MIRHFNKTTKLEIYARKYLNKSSTEKLVNSLVTSNLDYCNSLLYGLPSSKLNRLQRIQNTAARIIMRTRKYDHITPVLKQLHWLPISSRIEFKILLFTYRALNNLAPAYVRDMLCIYEPPRPLRSAGMSLLVVPKTRLSTYGDRCFQKAAPVLWNNLPDTVKRSDTLDIFKKRLKTHLFINAFTD